MFMNVCNDTFMNIWVFYNQNKNDLITVTNYILEQRVIFDNLIEYNNYKILYNTFLTKCYKNIPLINNNNVLELTRLWIEDGYGKNIESYCIADSFRQINKDYPEIKCILSYADSEVGHTGKIYQATGFIYQGDNYVDVALMPNYSVSLSGPPDYNWIHSRTVFSKWKTHNVDKLKERIGRTFWRKKESGKHRYIKFISNKIENKKLSKSLKHPSRPYPLIGGYKEDIMEIKVENTNEQSFF